MNERALVLITKFGGMYPNAPPFATSLESYTAIYNDE